MHSLGLHGAVVFDSHPDHSATHPIRADDPHLEIIYSPTNLDADEYILEYLSTYKRGSQPIILVTSDNELAFKAKSFGASILGVKDFLKKLHEKELHTTKAEEKPNLECRYQLQRLLELFENRYNSGP